MTQDIRLQRLDRAIRASFYALIFFLPISIALVSTFSGFAVFFYLIKRTLVVRARPGLGAKAVIEFFRPPVNVLNLPLLLLLAASTISFAFSQYYEPSAMGMLKVLRGILLYLGFVEAFSKAKQMRYFVFVWAASAFVTAMSGLSQYFQGVDFIRWTYLMEGRVSSSLRHANDFGAYIVSIGPVLMTLILFWRFSQQKNDNYFFIVTLAVLLWCLGLTMSRSSWVAFIAATVLVGLYQKKLLPCLLILLALFIALFSPIMAQTRDASLISDNLNMEEASKPPDVPPPAMTQVKMFFFNIGTGRWEFWEEGLKVFQAYPIWGCGINAYSLVAPRYKVTWGGYAHNSYLQMTAETGILGLAAFVFLIVSWFRGCAAHIRRWAPGYKRTLMIGLMAGVTAHLVQSFFDTTFYSVQLSVLLWLMLAAAVALQRLPEDRSN